MPNVLMCLYVYSCCSGSATADAEEYRQRFPVRRIPDCRVFSKVFNTVYKCSTLPSAHVSSEQAHQQHVKEQENILEMVLCNPTTRSEDFLRVSMFHKHVYGKNCMKMTCAHFTCSV